MKKLTLSSPEMAEGTTKEVYARAFWRVSTAIRNNRMQKEKAENRINFLLGNPSLKSKKLQEQLLKLRSVNRERADVRNTP